MGHFTETRFTDGLYTNGPRAHTHRELRRFISFKGADTSTHAKRTDPKRLRYTIKKNEHTRNMELIQKWLREPKGYSQEKKTSTHAHGIDPKVASGSQVPRAKGAFTRTRTSNVYEYRIYGPPLTYFRGLIFVFLCFMYFTPVSCVMCLYRSSVVRRSSRSVRPG